MVKPKNQGVGNILLPLRERNCEVQDRGRTCREEWNIGYVGTVPHTKENVAYKANSVHSVKGGWKEGKSAGGETGLDYGYNLCRRWPERELKQRPWQWRGNTWRTSQLLLPWEGSDSEKKQDETSSEATAQWYWLSHVRLSIPNIPPAGSETCYLSPVFDPRQDDSL